MFYREVAQAVIIFGSETWEIFVEMERKLEGRHTGFLIRIMGKQLQQIEDGTWETLGAEVVREAVGMQLSMTYI